ncbi:peptidase family S41 [Oxobacter pfennigii]|uniref:Peptidase family S41 n=1 Tax=Oxobacter pfennigii TaxID=36849 RepID=A0A0P8WCL3_9CLOT|nr:S41 family peptidase [Oxobacter pfennigii]KPU45607.1 peptidase family S41 [Oxobacter pfennigii]
MKRLILLLLTGMILLVSCSDVTGDKEITADEWGNKIFEVSELRKDFKEFEETVKLRHPMDFTDKEKINKIFEAQYKAINENMTEYEFYKVLAPIVSRLNCGNTVLNYSAELEDKRYYHKKYFPLYMYTTGDGIYSDHGNNYMYKHARILSINGRDSRDILDTLKENISSDNGNMPYKNYIINSDFNNLYYKFIENADIYEVTFVDSQSGKVRYLYYNALDMEALDEKKFRADNDTKDIIFEIHLEMDFAVLKVKSFDMDIDEFKDTIDKSFLDIKDKNIHNLILDLRGNSGRNPYHAAYLLTYLINKPLLYLSRQTPGFDDLKTSLEPSLKAFSGNLYTLTDPGCTSAAAQLCALLKHNGIRTLIGSEERLLYSYMDDIEEIRLKNTGIRFSYPTKFISADVPDLRPFDGEVPHYIIDTQENNEGKDMVREKAYELIGEARRQRDTQEGIIYNKYPAGEIIRLEAVSNRTIAYINNSGYLIIRDIKENKEKRALIDFKVGEYDIDIKNNKIAYIRYSGEEFFDNNVYIYDVLTKERQALDTNTHAREVAFSPSGRYLAVEYGTSPMGFLRIYDIKNMKWLDITSGSMDLREGTREFKWAPGQDVLALSLWEFSDEYTPVMDGETYSSGLYHPSDNTYKELMKGTGEYGAVIEKWFSNNTLCIARTYYEDSSKNLYYLVNINDGNIKEINKYEAVPKLPDSAPIEVKWAYYNASPDNKTILYSFHDITLKCQVIMAWDIEKNISYKVCEGYNPKWIE